MDRCAVFVDAGYLYAEGGKLCCGTPSRQRLLLDAHGIVRHLTTLAEAQCGLPVLRTYWYDGAKDGVPTTAQQIIAALPNVKLRLGRLNSRQEQKGVDALIYRDLMTLARERAISDALLVSGDEDLREGVRAAQDMGVRVTLVGIDTAGKGFNQSRDLINEADEIHILTKADLADILTERRTIVSSTGPVVDDPLSQTRVAAAEFAKNWSTKATRTDLISLHAERPRIPTLLDAELLQAVEHRVGIGLRGVEQLRRAARKAFWESISAAPPLD